MWRVLKWVDECLTHSNGITDPSIQGIYQQLRNHNGENLRGSSKRGTGKVFIFGEKTRNRLSGSNLLITVMRIS
jgi:hypothetical protein